MSKFDLCVTAILCIAFTVAPSAIEVGDLMLFICTIIILFTSQIVSDGVSMDWRAGLHAARRALPFARSPVAKVRHD